MKGTSASWNAVHEQQKERNPDAYHTLSWRYGFWCFLLRFVFDDFAGVHRSPRMCWLSTFPNYCNTVCLVSVGSVQLGLSSWSLRKPGSVVSMETASLSGKGTSARERKANMICVLKSRQSSIPHLHANESLVIKFVKEKRHPCGSRKKAEEVGYSRKRLSFI